MLDICFSEGASKSLKCTRTVRDSTQAIVCIPDDLSVGDIINITDFEARKRSMLQFHSNFYNDSEEFSVYINTVCRKLYQEFYDEIENHQEIMIWYSNSPYDFCGMLYTLWLLRDSTASIRAVNCSHPILKEDCVVFHHSTGEIDAKSFCDFSPYIQSITNEQKQAYASRWEKLVEENGLLRVFDGDAIDETELSYTELLKKLADEDVLQVLKANTIKTAEFSYYDEFILSQIPSTPILVGNAVGTILGRLAMYQHINIGDGIISIRINALIEQGILKMEGHHEKLYENTIVRRKQTNL